MYFTIFFLYLPLSLPLSFFFFFNDTATTEIYTLSLHDALPIYSSPLFVFSKLPGCGSPCSSCSGAPRSMIERRSEEHTSELQSHSDLVCRLLLEKKKKKKENYLSYK